MIGTQPMRPHAERASPVWALAAFAALLMAGASCSGPVDHERDAAADAMVDCPEPAVWSAALQRCVECTEDSHCFAMEACARDEGRCVRCTDDAHCSGILSFCVDQECRQCAETSDCESPVESRCSAEHLCEPCRSDADCAHLAGLGVCDASECVECSPGNASACEGRVCDGRHRTCTERAPRQRGLCETCVADIDCKEGLICIPPHGEQETGTAHCYWRLDAPEPGPNGSCFGVRPYVQRWMTPSVDGERAPFCKASLASCEALRAFSSSCESPGPPGEPAPSEACSGLLTLDGYCAASPAGGGVCTVRCHGHYDCPCADEACTANYACVGASTGTPGFCSSTITCTFPELECT